MRALRHSLVAVLAITTFARLALADAPYADSATSTWFKELSAPASVLSCCDQADCKRARSDYRDGSWWALSNRTGTWVRILPEQITSVISIFPEAILCEGNPHESDAEGVGTPAQEPRVFCFAIPPLGF